jgi:hypothetical protein
LSRRGCCRSARTWPPRPPRPAARTIAAPFSAIMIVGAFVLVEVTAGITEASITRNPPQVNPGNPEPRLQIALEHPSLILPQAKYTLITR